MPLFIICLEPVVLRYCLKDLQTFRAPVQMVKVVFIEHFEIQRKFVKPVYADMFKFHDAAPPRRTDRPSLSYVGARVTPVGFAMDSKDSLCFLSRRTMERGSTNVFHHTQP